MVKRMHAQKGCSRNAPEDVGIFCSKYLQEIWKKAAESGKEIEKSITLGKSKMKHGHMGGVVNENCKERTEQVTVNERRRIFSSRKFWKKHFQARKYNMLGQ